MYVYTHTQGGKIYMCVSICMYTHTGGEIYMCVSICMYTHTQGGKYICVCLYICIHTHTHAYTHTCTEFLKDKLNSSHVGVVIFAPFLLGDSLAYSVGCGDAIIGNHSYR